MDIRVVPNDHMGRSKTKSENGYGVHVKIKPAVEKEWQRFMGQQVVELTNDETGKVFVRYKNCMRNHAASIGGHANDGCGEFMPGGEEGTREALRCAACGCHRNFHRKELPEGCADHLCHLPQSLPSMLLYNATELNPSPRWEKKMGGGFPPLPALSLSQPPPPPFHPQRMFGGVDLRNHRYEQSDMEKNDRRLETPEREEVQMGVLRNKRFRTKFTQEQKSKMMEFAERLGWRIQKHDDIAVSQFCKEVGVKRNVLKVWMHNKNALRKKENALPPPLPISV